MTQSKIILAFFLITSLFSASDYELTIKGGQTVWEPVIIFGSTEELIKDPTLSCFHFVVLRLKSEGQNAKLEVSKGSGYWPRMTATLSLESNDVKLNQLNFGDAVEAIMNYKNWVSSFPNLDESGAFPTNQVSTFQTINTQFEGLIYWQNYRSGIIRAGGKNKLEGEISDKNNTFKLLISMDAVLVDEKKIEVDPVSLTVELEFDEDEGKENEYPQGKIVAHKGKNFERMQVWQETMSSLGKEYKTPDDETSDRNEDERSEEENQERSRKKEEIPEPPKKESDESTPSKEKMSAGKKAGIAVAIILPILILVAGGTIFFMRKNAEKGTRELDKN